MEISLPPDLEQYVHDQVNRGVYPSVNDAVREAVESLRAQAERDARREELLREIDVGIAEAERGELGPLDVEWIKAEGRRVLAERRTE
jgi:antitoxin ParD1/3/4